MSVGDATFDAEYNLHKNAVISIEMESEKIGGSKKEHILKMIQILLDYRKVEPQKVSTKLYSDLEGYVSEQYIRYVCSSVGCTDQSKTNDRYATEDAETGDDSDAGDDENNAGEPGDAQDQAHDNSSAFERGLCETSPMAKERYQLIWFYNEIIAGAKACIIELKKDYDEVPTKVNDQIVVTQRPRNWNHLFASQQESTEYVTALKDMFVRMSETWRKCFDERQSLLPFMLLPVLAKVSVTTIKHFSTKHFVHVKNVWDITPKKCTQFLKSEETVNDLLKSVRDEAWKFHFLDIKCPICREEMLLAKMYANGTWDFVCKNWMAHNDEEKHFPSTLFTDRLASLKDNVGGASTTYMKKRGLEK